MDPSTASYYRAILFSDSQAEKPLPSTLVELHRWAEKRNHALGLGGVVTKAVALSVAMTWMSSTKDGRTFSTECTPLGDLFGDYGEVVDDSDDDVIGGDDWDALPVESEVSVTMKDKSTKAGKFVQRRGSWVDVRVNGEVQHFRISKVKIVGA